MKSDHFSAVCSDGVSGLSIQNSAMICLSLHCFANIG